MSWSDSRSIARVARSLGIPPVHEVIRPEENGLVVPLFDVEGLTETALRVLDDPAEFAPLGRTIEEAYSVEVCIPPLKDFFERVYYALLEETRMGLEVITSGDTAAGAQRFAAGAGRHGRFDD